MNGRRRTHRAQPSAHCSCIHVVDTPAWTGSHGEGSGLSTQNGAQHGEVFAHKGACIHSELSFTTTPRRARPTVQRLDLR